MDRDAAQERPLRGEAAQRDDTFERPFQQSVDHHRLVAEEVGHLPGIDLVHVQATPVYPDVGQHGRLDALMEAFRRRAALLLQRYVFYLASPGVRHPVQQETIDAVTDAEGEDTGGSG